MDKTTNKVKLVCGLQKQNDWWYFYFGHREGSLIYSPKLPSKQMVEKMMNDEINHVKSDFGSNFEVMVERKDS